MRPRSTIALPPRAARSELSSPGDLFVWGEMLDYAHPREVLCDDGLDIAQKRALLAAWASDACAVESHPGFRWLPGTPGPIAVEHILAALRSLDEESLSGWMTGAPAQPELRP
jgi:hypothetical protein